MNAIATTSHTTETRVTVLATHPVGGCTGHRKRGNHVGFLETIVVHVADAASGEISVMSGESEVILRDRTIVSRIVAAANGHLSK